MAVVKPVVTEYSVRDGGHYTPGMVHNGTIIHFRSVIH